MRNGRRLAITFMILPLAACATADEMVLPDGNKGYNISCDGAFLSMGDCYKKAGELCPRGYDLFAQSNEANSLGYSTGQFIGGGFVTTYGSVILRDLYVQCK